MSTSVPAQLLAILRTSIDPARVHVAGAIPDGVATLWNAAVKARPGVVVRCVETVEVQACVRAAVETGTPLSVRGGGHAWTGAAIVDDGLVIDLSSMADVTVDRDAGTAEIGGGTTSAELAAVAERAGFSAVTGTVGSVGVVGLSLGGGYGPLSGAHGLALDNMVSAEVVLADGSVVLTDTDHEPDLFWALRGGGGNFGVVTSMQVRLAETPTVTTGLLLFSWDQARDVFDAVGEIALHGPDHLTTQFGVVSSPAGPAMFVLPTWCGPIDEADAVIEALVSLGTPLQHQIGELPLSALLAQSETMFPFGRHVELRTRTLDTLSADAIDAVVAAGESIRPMSGISLHSLHGVPTRIEADATAFPVRTAHLMVEAIAIWEPGDGDAERHRRWARDLAEALEPSARPGGYVNLLAADATDQIADAYGANAARLLDVKRCYDPGHVFRATPLPPQPVS